MSRLHCQFRCRVFLVLLTALPLTTAKLSGALGYEDNKALTKHLKDLAKDHRKIVRVEKAAETLAKNEIWHLDVGNGSDEERRQRPAMLVVAGAEGNDLAGTASAVAWVESLAKSYETDDKIRKLLDSTTIYVWPRLNPDAARRFFTKPRLETAISDQPVDDDHDGLKDEDGPDDLNGDGLITWMRVEDSDGEYMLDPVEPRLLLKADPIKGERGRWRYLSEGRDNDGDKAWNEDGVGGVNFNRNFPFSFKFFAAGSGRHQISEIETRALADFVIAHPNIGIVFTFGAADNLVQTPKGESPKRPPVAIHESDVAWYRELGKVWRDAVGLKKELSGASESGTISDWAYFHRGRLSLAARPWSPALQLELAKIKPKDDAKKEGDSPKENAAKAKDGKSADDTTKKDDAAGQSDGKQAEKGKDADTRNEEERAFLKWLDENAKEEFLPWTAYAHPDFPGKKVEIGGLAPYVRSNPPERLLGEIAGKHGVFLTQLAGKLPRIGVRKAEAKHLGESVYDITVAVENTGYFPTALAQGGLTREVHPTRVILKTDDKFILSGARITMLNAIPGGEAKEARWVIRAKGKEKLDVEVISMLGGRVQTSIELKEGAK